VSATKWSEGKCVIEQLQYDMIRFMSPEARQAILLDHMRMVNKAIVSPFWSPTCYEEQIVAAPQEDKEPVTTLPNARKPLKK
jgi:hypothetical protein